MASDMYIRTLVYMYEIMCERLDNGQQMHETHKSRSHNDVNIFVVWVSERHSDVRFTLDVCR